MTISGASAQSLDEALDWSLRSSVSIKSDDSRQDAAVSKLRGSVDAFMPTVSYVQERILSSKISYSPDFIVPTEAGKDSTARREPNASGFQASLPIFDGLRRYNNFRSAKIGVETGKVLQVEKRQQVMLDASTAYLAVIRDRKIVELRQRQVSDIATIAIRTKARLSVHDATLTDVDLANSRLLAAQVALDQATADLTSSNIDFERMTGNAPQALIEPQVPDSLIPSTVEEVQALVVQTNPRLQAARLDATAAGYLAKAQIADILPQVNLVASHMKQTDISEALNNATDSTVKIQMRVPIYEPGALPRLDEGAALARQKSWDAIDSQKQGVAAATSLFLGRVSTIRQIETTGARVKSMQKAVEGYRIEQSAGFRTIIDILNARNELADAQVTKANLEFARDKQTFMLAAALVRLGPTPTLLPQSSPPLLATIATLTQPVAATIAPPVRPILMAAAQPLPTSNVAANPPGLPLELVANPASASIAQQPSIKAERAATPATKLAIAERPLNLRLRTMVSASASSRPRTSGRPSPAASDAVTSTAKSDPATPAGQALNLGRFMVTSTN